MGISIVNASIGSIPYTVELSDDLGHRWVGDEPEDLGGANAGPSPEHLLLSALGACTAMTLRLYADLKAIPLERVSVELEHEKIHAADCAECETREGKIDRIDRLITLDGDLDPAQKQKLIEIADKCPIHRTLHSEDLAVQRRALVLFEALGSEYLDDARRHYEIIARFGRFPHRNTVLGRESTPEETEFLKTPGSSF